jgi:pimeloyl-ACP methyl ester carboxylesterase
VRVLLLPGLDGTGTLFSRLIAVAPPSWRCQPLRYPSDESLDYDELEVLVRERVLAEDAPTLIVAESFSGPLAIALAAHPPATLRAVVLVASFARSPVPRLAGALLGPRRFRRPPMRAGIRLALTGCMAPRDQVDAVRAAIAEVDPRVLADRIQAILAVDRRAQLVAATRPILVLRASGDRLVPRRALAPLPPTAREVVIAGPHLLLQLRPRACASAIEEFLRELDG